MQTYPGSIVTDHHFPSLAVHYVKAPVAAEPPLTFFGKPGRKTRQPGREEEGKGAHPVCDGGAQMTHSPRHVYVS